MRLRDEQLTAIERDLTQTLRKVRLAGFFGVTGYGKGHLIADLSRRAHEKGKLVWVITPQGHLVEDLHQRLTALGVPHGTNAGGTKKLWTRPVQIFTNISAGKVLERWDELAESEEAQKYGELAEPHLVLVDEAHYDLEGQRRLFAKFPKARGIGFSGSPIGMGAVYQRLVLGPSIAEMTLKGRLVPLYAYECKPLDPSMLRAKLGDDGEWDTDFFWAKNLKRGEVVGDILKTYDRFCRDRHTLIRTGHKSAAHIITLQLREQGIEATYVDSSLSTSDRLWLFDNFSRQPGSLLIYADVLTQGADIPRADAFMPVCPTKSLRIVSQSQGRTLRTLVDSEDRPLLKPDGKLQKEFALLLDHAGWINTHGLIYHYEPEDWAELFHARDGYDERPKLSRIAQRMARTFKCGFCGMIYEGKRKCPNCGAVKYEELKAYDRFGPKLKIRALGAFAGELLPVGTDVTPKLTAAQRETFRQLLGVAEQKGYKRGWALHKFEAKYNRKPAREWWDDAPLPPPPWLCKAYGLSVGESRSA